MCSVFCILHRRQRWLRGQLMGSRYYYTGPSRGERGERGSVQKAQKLTAPTGAGSWRNVSGHFPLRLRFGLTPAPTGREAANTGAGKGWRMEPAETSLRPRPAVGSGVDTKLGQSRAPVTLACQGSGHHEVTLIIDATLRCVCAVRLCDVRTWRMPSTGGLCCTQSVQYTEHRSTKHGPGHRGDGP